MAAFVARRAIWMVLVLFVVSLVTFFLMRAVPGGPFDREKELPAAIIANLEAKYNLDAPVFVQYADYIGDILVPRITASNLQRSATADYLLNIDLPGDTYTIRWGNFGPSLTQRSRTVTSILKENLPTTFQLGMASMLVALTIGLPGMLAALNRNTVWDYVGMGVATIGVSITIITLGPILQYFFGVQLGVLPISGWGTLKHFILPSIALGFGQAALIARLTRASLLQVLNEDYIRTARAKGLHERRVITLHALKNALIPVVTVLGPLAAYLLTGSFVTEQIFAIPGIGEKFVSSISTRDYPVIMGTTLLYSFILVVANTLVDISYAWIDPRIRFS
jgi:ABC-type dipeptide/oligopeptide/nickel transport system permease component